MTPSLHSPGALRRAVWFARECPQAAALRWGGRSQATPPRVRFHPAVASDDDWRDLCSKIHHYLPPGSVRHIEIPVALSRNGGSITADPCLYPDYAAPVPTGPRRDLRIRRSRCASLAAALCRADLVYVWDWSSVRPGGAASHSARVLNVDRARNVSEAWVWCDHLYRQWPAAARAAALAESRVLLANFLASRPRLPRAYVFGTGPSLEQAWQRDWSDGYRIVCNTIVNNRDLLRHLKPHIVVAGDAAYHFDINLHAAAFRRDLARALDEHDMLFVTRDLYGPLLGVHHPDIRRKTILAEAGVGAHFDITQRLVYHQWPQGNILNALLLPLASALADEIVLLGFDGRAPNDSGFWRNAAASTYDAFKPAIKAAHPAFFAIDFNAYAQAHSDNAETLMQAGEAMGKRYTCLNDSYIPAFRQRRAARA